MPYPSRPALASLFAAALTAASVSPAAAVVSFALEGSAGSMLTATHVASFERPWAMTFLPDGRLLVTTKPGKLHLMEAGGRTTEVDGVWEVAYGGQGGFGDVVLHPDYAANGWIYFSSVESLDGGATAGAIVVRAKLDESGDRPTLIEIERIWTQAPKVSGRGHFSHRIAFGPDGMLFITSGDRQKLTPAQDFSGALGKVVRLHDDGATPADNPWQDQGDIARTFWSMGHRNMLGIDFDAEGRLWVHEMGPRHGDELNRIEPGSNQGWPEVSMGDHYSGVPIKDHARGDGFNPPEAYWVPAISPSGFVIYQGALFPEWKGDGFMGGLSSRALVRVDIAGAAALEAERFEWGERVREVEEGPDGALWVLEDGPGARLLKLTPGTEP